MAKKTAAKAAPQQNEEIQETLNQADPTAEEILSTPDAPPAPDQVVAWLPPEPQQVLQQADPTLVTLAEIDMGMLTPEQQQLATNAARLLTEAAPAMNDTTAATRFASLGGGVVERIRKMRDSATQQRLLKPKKGETLADVIARQNTSLDDVIERRAGAILTKNGKDKTVAVKMTPAQAHAQAVAEQEGVAATFVAMSKHSMGRRMVRALTTSISAQQVAVDSE